jgi:hypothetical protein
MKSAKYISSFLLLAAAFTACRKERNLAYEGPSVIEFSNPLSGVNTKVTGQSIGGASGIGGDPKIPIRGLVDSMIVQLIGKQMSEPITVSYSIVPGTAVEGVDYAIIGTKGSVVIPANSSAASIKLQLLNTSTNPSAINTVSFTITGTDKADIKPSENNKTYSTSIYPMKAYLGKTLTAGAASARYFSSRTGLVYSAADAVTNAAVIDIAYVYESGVAKLVSPASLLAGAVDTKYSARVFAPAATVPVDLIQSYATLQLNAVTSTTVNAIPASGTTAVAATLASVNIVTDGIYGFVGASGKKGYIRIKSVTATETGIDMMTQP